MLSKQGCVNTTAMSENMLPSPSNLLQMRSWVITGGVACGKSTVLTELRERLGGRIAVFSSDEAVHQAYGDAELKARLAQRFGAQALQTGEVNREYLSSCVFEDVQARKELEALLHPVVLLHLEEARRRAAEEQRVNLFVAEVPLYHEIGEAVSADLVIVVASSPDEQIRRLTQLRGLDINRSKAILAAQWPILDKAAKASKVLWNDGALEALTDQIITLLSDFD